jgi:hypothetical protein
MVKQELIGGVRIWESLESAVAEGVDLTEYPTAQLPDGTEGWYIGCRGNSASAGYDGSTDKVLAELYGERLHVADGCTVEIDEGGEVLGYGANPLVVSYAVRKSQEEISQAANMRSDWMTRLLKRFNKNV